MSEVPLYMVAVLASNRTKRTAFQGLIHRAKNRSPSAGNRALLQTS
jgi:hypothetical protein